MNGQQSELRALFCEAVECPTLEGRAAYLDVACEGKPELRARVDALLQAHEDASSFLQEPSITASGTSDVAMREGPGTKIGPYQLLEQIGEGGFGLVFKAEQRHPVRRQVAIKVLKPGMDSREVIARFEAERQALVLMDHPNIARVLDAGETASGRSHFVMELVPGIPITDYCDQNSLAIRQRLELFATVCEAVQHAHQKGILHRDIKPSNVLVALQYGASVVKVIDFGIAKAIGQHLTDNTFNTGAAQLIGTPLYMSPEQALMGTLDIDTRTDVYSLGVLLFELLTGTTPFDKDRLRDAGYDEMRRIIREEDPQRPSSRLTTLGPAAATASAVRRSDPRRLSLLFRGELDWIVMKALEKDRTRRYETASAFAADVNRYLRDEPVAACPPSAWYLFRKFARRRRAALSMAAVVMAALALAAGSIGWAARDRGARHAIVVERDAAVKSRDLAELAEQRARAAERENEIRADLGQATALRLSQEPGRRARALAEIRAAVALDPSPALSLELRNEAIACLAISLDLSPGREVGSWPAGSNRFAFDEKLERYARADFSGNVSIRNLKDDAEVGRIARTGTETLLRFSPDGQYFLTFSVPSSMTKVWKLQSNPPTLLFQSETSAFEFHPAKPLVAIGLNDNSFKVLDLNMGNERRYQTGFQVNSLTWRPGLNQIAVSLSNGVKVYDLDTRQWVVELGINVAPRKEGLVWHPDGRMLAIRCTDKSVKLWNAESGNKGHAFPLERLIGEGTAMSFSRRGNLLATTDWGGFLKLWDPRTGKLLKAIDWNNGEIPRFSSDDSRIAAKIRGQSLQFCDVIEADEYRTFTRDANVSRIFWTGAIGRDGRLLAVGMEDGVGLWDLKTGDFLSFLPIGETCGVAFDHSSTPALITNGAGGACRWPIAAGPEATRVRIGPPQMMPFPGSSHEIATSRDGQAVLQPAGPSGARVLWRNSEKVVPLTPHPDARYVAISPNNRWVATGAHNAAGARVWDAASGKQVRELSPEEPSWGVEFSGDGKWLATQAPFCQLWNAGTWERALQFPGTQFSFAPDGKMLAVETGSGVVRLLDPASGREFARLENPFRDKASRICFSQDGAFLVTLGWEPYPLHVWDLRKIRGQLKELNLDWDMPPYLPAGPDWLGGQLQVQLELGHFSSRLP